MHCGYNHEIIPDDYTINQYNLINTLYMTNRMASNEAR